MDNRSGRDFCSAVESLIAEFRARRPIRTGSLLISVFGDAIVPHGGTVWLGSLINALQTFGISQRLVRTSVFRLARDGWLQNELIGRRSYYSLTPQGRQRFQDASRRIYSEPRYDWSGRWCLLLLSGVEGEHREDIRREMAWLGFGQFAPNILAHPAADTAAVRERLEQIAGADGVLLMAATADDRQALLRRLVSDAWSLGELDQRYATFLDRFRPVYALARASSGIDTRLAFELRMLLIHEYRKIVLRDPALPHELLPEGWSGVAAYQLCRNLYSLIAAPTEAYLTARLESAEGPLPPADPSFFQRFGGLDDIPT